jgi:phosphopentomutase
MNEAMERRKSDRTCKGRSENSNLRVITSENEVFEIMCKTDRIDRQFGFEAAQGSIGTAHGQSWGRIAGRSLGQCRTFRASRCLARGWSAKEAKGKGIRAR